MIADLVEDDFKRMAQLVEQYEDFPLGVSDASRVAIAERRSITIILTTDRRLSRWSDFSISRGSTSCPGLSQARAVPPLGTSVPVEAASGSGARPVERCAAIDPRHTVLAEVSTGGVAGCGRDEETACNEPLPTNESSWKSVAVGHRYARRSVCGLAEPPPHGKGDGELIADLLNALAGLLVGLATGFYFERRSSRLAAVHNDELEARIESLRAVVISLGGDPEAANDRSIPESTDLAAEVREWIRAHQDASGRVSRRDVVAHFMASGFEIVEVRSAIDNMVLAGRVREEGDRWLFLI